VRAGDGFEISAGCQGGGGGLVPTDLPPNLRSLITQTLGREALSSRRFPLLAITSKPRRSGGAVGEAAVSVGVVAARGRIGDVTPSCDAKVSSFR
jgi:hypothetical protein